MLAAIRATGCRIAMPPPAMKLALLFLLGAAAFPTERDTRELAPHEVADWHRMALLNSVAYCYPSVKEAWECKHCRAVGDMRVLATGGDHAATPWCKSLLNALTQTTSPRTAATSSSPSRAPTRTRPSRVPTRRRSTPSSPPRPTGACRTRGASTPASWGRLRGWRTMCSPLPAAAWRRGPTPSW